jgi:hypothetical protein
MLVTVDEDVRTILGEPEVAELQPHPPVGEGDALEEGLVAVGQDALLILGENLGEDRVTHVVGHHVGRFDPYRKNQFSRL